MHGLVIMLAIRAVVYLLSKKTGSSQSASNALRIDPRIWGFALRAGFLVVGLLVLTDDLGPGWAWLCLCGALPQLVLSAVLIPAGLPFVAYYFTRVTWPRAVFSEPRGGATFNELRARLRWGLRLSRTATQRLTQGLVELGKDSSDRRVRGATLTARAILDALNGDRDQARELFLVAQGMNQKHSALSTRAYCQAWLLTDAAARGAYHEVVRIAARGPRTRRRWFLRTAALRMLGIPHAPARKQLVLSWLLAPARRHGLQLLRSAWRAEPRSELGIGAQGVSGARDALFGLLRQPKGVVTRGEIRSVARAFQRALESKALQAWLGTRQSELQAHFDPTQVSQRFENEVVSLLTRLWQDSLADRDEEEEEQEDPLLILVAKDRLQFNLLAEMENVCHTLPRGQARAPSDDLEPHWRNWAHVRYVAQTFTDALPDRAYMIYDSVGTDLLNHGAWLYNHEHARILAHDIFRWLSAITPEGADRQTVLKNAKLSG